MAWVKRPRYCFKHGDILHDPKLGKYYRVERLATLFGVRWLMRSLESGNPGNLKNGPFIHLQIQDGHLVRMTKRQYIRATR